jgi:hypothetical protein
VFLLVRFEGSVALPACGAGWVISFFDLLVPGGVAADGPVSVLEPDMPAPAVPLLDLPEPEAPMPVVPAVPLELVAPAAPVEPEPLELDPLVPELPAVPELPELPLVPLEESGGIAPDWVPLEPDVPGMPAPAAPELDEPELLLPPGLEELPPAPVCACVPLPNASAAATAAARGRIFRDGLSNMKSSFLPWEAC